MSVGIDGYLDVINLKPADRVDAVAGARAELERLSYRCFPSYRPLIGEYEMILREVISGKDKGIPGRLEKLSDVRLRLKEAGMRSRDYLDWYYITRSNEVSGDFKQYRELSGAIQKEMMKPRSNDSLENYLEAIQQLYGADRRR